MLTPTQSPTNRQSIDETPIRPANIADTSISAGPDPDHLIRETASSAPRELSPDDMSAIVKDRVFTIINHLLMEFNIDALQVQLPLVRASNGADTSYYSPQSNEIVIHPEHLNQIATYGEEIFHWLRNQLKPESERLSVRPALPREEQFAVEEFFGFVGRAVINELCQSTALSSLCDASLEDISSTTIENHKKSQESNQDLLRKLPISMIPNIKEVSNHLTKINLLSKSQNNLVYNEVDVYLNLLKLAVESWREAFTTISSKDDAMIKLQEKHLNNLEVYCSTLEKLIKPSTTTLNSSDSSQVFDQNLDTIRKNMGVAKLFAEDLKVYIDILIKTSEQREVWKDKDGIHIPGYEAGQRFLEGDTDHKASIQKLLGQSSLDVYMAHIFTEHLPPTGSSLFGVMASKILGFWKVAHEKDRLNDKLDKEMFMKSLGIKLDASGRKDRAAIEKSLKNLSGDT